MFVQVIVMEEDDDIEALRLAALQTIRPRVTVKRNINTISHHRQIEKIRNGPFIRVVNNPNLIAIVPSELPPVKKEPVKPKVVTIQQVVEKKNYISIDKNNVPDKSSDIKDKAHNEPVIAEDSKQENSDDLKENKVDSVSMYDLEEDVLDFETESVAGSEEDLLQLHDSDSDSLEKLMESIEKELSTTPSHVQPKAHSRLKSDSSKNSDTNVKRKPSENSTSKQKVSLSVTHSGNHKSPPRNNHVTKQNSPPKVENSKINNLKPSIYDKVSSPSRRRYSPPKQHLKQNSPVHRLHSPRRSPMRKRSLSPRKRSITPRKRSISPRKRSPYKRSLSPRRSPSLRKRSLTPRKRSLTPPRKRSLTPHKRSHSPRKRSLTPRKRSLTPRKRSLTPRKRSLSPRKRSLTPRRRSITPRKRSLTPRKRSLSPRKRSLSPRRRSITPCRLSPRRRSISPRRRSPRRRSISQHRRTLSPRRRSRSPWRRSPSPRRSPRRRSPTPKKRSLTPRRRSITPKKRSLSPRKRSLSPRKRSLSPRHNSLGKRKRVLSPLNTKRTKRLTPLGNRKQWIRTKSANTSSRQGSTNSKSSSYSSNRSNNTRNSKEEDKINSRGASREIKTKEKVSEVDVKVEQTEKKDDNITQQPLDPKLEARKRKFENNFVIESVNKKICLKWGKNLERENVRLEEDNSGQETTQRTRVKRKRIVLDDRKVNKEVKPKETQPVKPVVNDVKSPDSEKSKKLDEEDIGKKKTRDNTKDELHSKKGVDLRTELSRRRAERLKGAPIDPMARIVQSALEGAVGKIKSKSRPSPSSDSETLTISEKKSKPKGRRVHVVENVHSRKSSKLDDKKTDGEDKNIGLAMRYQSTSPVKMSGRSILRRNQV